ncbi:MAG: hypothetical protein IJP94_02540 [Clostridia bacterium]|nr:hypothetical protein [Clostridia bacterium]MBQ3464142.1 hypothetical protein [Clostridia bacterium]MBQ3471100.1 hypothetical protein [Clostridia bacterium]MBQ6530023.1 hypothetical protein [Clostridia bacterium]MBQ6558613.1 hypothetical protein [Clostridia bacterium]
MDYKRLKTQTSAVKREKILWITLAVLAAVIIVQIVTSIFMMSSINHYKSLYEESLGERLTMQEKINSLTGANDVGANYSQQDSGTANENAAGEKKDIPFVTEGKELNNESSVNN